MAWPTSSIPTIDMDAGTDSAALARAAIKAMADAVNEIMGARGTADGIASLDSSGKVPTAQLPTVPANKGGTGQTSYTIGDLLYASSSSALSKLPAGTNGYVLKSNGAGAAPTWQQEGGGFTSGTRMLFNQTSAPTGWTKDTTATLNDSILRIVTGSVGGGGSNAFSTVNGLSSVGATTLSSSQMPSHSHNVRGNTSFASGSNNIVNVLQPTNTGSSNVASDSSTGGAGSGGSHTHSLNLEIKYNDVIIATKD